MARHAALFHDNFHEDGDTRMLDIGSAMDSNIDNVPQGTSIRPENSSITDIDTFRHQRINEVATNKRGSFRCNYRYRPATLEKFPKKIEFGLQKSITQFSHRVFPHPPGAKVLLVPANSRTHRKPLRAPNTEEPCSG